MKNKILLTLLASFFTGMIFAQNVDSTVNVGDVLTIGEVENNDYQHINFPRANFIIKKGGLPNYSYVKGEKVEITSVKEKNGSLIATIKLTSRKSFFNSHKYITVDIEKALEGKELVRI
ncbi:dihydroorotase [Psychroflexus sp. CAK57W]|uniref:dihydroorotase n=1 Tax=Psychroflexus curvus TaxID=2873595 RepID=UPI001CCD0845|nr:dihydroorotase [Psychroflexus curvus]MBZ9788329.1 dihydroorotase [Psychroflexus curvus]